MMTPEQLIEKYDFSITILPIKDVTKVKNVLINYYSRQTLKHYQTTGKFLDPLDICLELPAKLKDLYLADSTLFAEDNRDNVLNEINKSKVTKEVKEPKEPAKEKTSTEWINNPDTVKKFGEFVMDKYELSETADTKFFLMLKEFTNKTGITTGSCWSPKYQPLCDRLGIKVEKIATSKYLSGGTYHAYMRIRI